MQGLRAFLKRVFISPGAFLDALKGLREDLKETNQLLKLLTERGEIPAELRRRARV